MQIKMKATHNEDSTLGCSKVNNERVNWFKKCIEVRTVNLEQFT